MSPDKKAFEQLPCQSHDLSSTFYLSVHVFFFCLYGGFLCWGKDDTHLRLSAFVWIKFLVSLAFFCEEIFLTPVFSSLVHVVDAHGALHVPPLFFSGCRGHLQQTTQMHWVGVLLHFFGEYPAWDDFAPRAKNSRSGLIFQSFFFLMTWSAVIPARQ